MNVAKKKMNVALLAFVDNENKILLNRRADAATEMWEFIGGGIEDNEEPLEAIKREILEEIGYQLSSETDELLFVNEFKFENDKISATVHFFTAKFPGLESFSDSEETYVEDLKLFSVSEALSLVLLPMTREILEKIYTD